MVVVLAGVVLVVEVEVEVDDKYNASRWLAYYTRLENEKICILLPITTGFTSVSN